MNWGTTTIFTTSRCCSRSTSEPSARALTEGLHVDLHERMLMPNIRNLREKVKPSKTNDGDGMRQAGSSIYLRRLG